MAVVASGIRAGGRAASAEGMRQTDAVLYVLWALFWLLMAAISLQDYLRAGGRQWWQPILWEGSSALMATFWLVLQRHADRHRHGDDFDRPWRWLWRHLRWLPWVVVSFVVGVYALRHGVYALLGHAYEHEPWLLVFVYETIKLALFVGLWLGIIFGLNSFQRWQDQRARLFALQKSLAETQLSQLKAQLRPHFFFNALNTISALMHVDVARADRLLARLGELLRASLQWGGAEMTALREELRLLELYAGIMQERFEDRVSLAWHIEPSALAGAVPVLLLQPLLENAFKHAVENSREPVRIAIEARRVGDRLEIAVRNTGSQLSDEASAGIGLRNCRERLQLIYGGAASLRLCQDVHSVEARISLPWREVGP